MIVQNENILDDSPSTEPLPVEEAPLVEEDFQPEPDLPYAEVNILT
jgi:hypothetical protein